MGRRRSSVDPLIEVGGALLDWCRRPHWTMKLRVAAVLAAVAGASWWLNSLKWGCITVAVVLGIFWAQRAIRWGIERHKVTLEAGLPPNPVQMVKHYFREREQFDQVEKRWEKLCRAQPSLKWDGQSPNLHRLRLTLAGDPEAYIDCGALGGDLEPVMKLAVSVMPAVMRCEEVSIRPGKKQGTAWITFCSSPPLARPFGIAELPPSGPSLISAGITEAGAVATMEYGLSVLAGGATGSGKSSWLWSVFADMRRDNIPVELFIVDPKRVELARFAKKVGERIGNIKIAGYVTTEADAKTMFAEFVEGMHERQDRLAEMGLRKVDTPTDEFPARIIVIDEMMDIVGAFSGKSSPLGIAISQGRATKDWVIGLTQQAKLSTLGADLRDLFPLRRGFRTATPENTKAIMTLGENEGVACSRIPRSLPGVGFAVDEDGSIVKFRTAYVSDEDADRLAEGLLPDGMLTANDMRGTTTWVYVAWLGNQCQYVGVATSVGDRVKQHWNYDRGWCHEHGQVENWWRQHVQVAGARLEKHQFPSRPAALAAEERMIKSLKPYWNIVHNKDNPLSNMALAGKDQRSGRMRRALDAGKEYVEVGREIQAVHQVKRDYAHQDRVAQQRAKHDRFMANIEAGRYVA